MATGITETDVWTAADALLLEGARPTIERVRQKIGAGRPTRSVRTWKRGFEPWARVSRTRAHLPAAPAIPDPIAQAAAHFWETALAEARAEQAETYRRRWAELAEEGERLAADAEQLQQREIQLANRELDLQEGLKVATAQLAATEDRLRAAEQQLRQRDDQLKQSQQQLEDARSAVQTLLTEAETMRSLHAQALEATETRHAAHERRWLNELDGERSAVKKLQVRLDEALIASQRQSCPIANGIDRGARGQACGRAGRSGVARRDRSRAATAACRGPCGKRCAGGGASARGGVGVAPGCRGCAIGVAADATEPEGRATG